MTLAEDDEGSGSKQRPTLEMEGESAPPDPKRPRTDNSSNNDINDQFANEFDMQYLEDNANRNHVSDEVVREVMDDDNLDDADGMIEEDAEIVYESVWDRPDTHPFQIPNILPTLQTPYPLV